MSTKQKRSAYDPLNQARALTARKGEPVPQAEIAREAGLKYTTVSAMLAPTYANKTLDAIDAIADAVQRIKTRPKSKK